MKVIFVVFFVLCLMFTYSQNLEDAYADHFGTTVWPQADNLLTYTGEYKIFLDKHFWAYIFHEQPPIRAVSYGFEIVSFPFIPREFEPGVIVLSIL